jgi:hypothetical protein
LGACVPNAVTYYRPSVDGGVVVTGGGCIPTNSRVKFSIENMLQIDANAFFNRRTKQLTIVLDLVHFPGHKVFFSSDQFKVNDIQKGSSISGVSVSASRSDGIEYLGKPLPTEDKSISPLDFNFSVYISFPDMDIGLFELLSPSIFIDGTEIEFPTIQFDRKIWMGISPLNC